MATSAVSASEATSNAAREFCHARRDEFYACNARAIAASPADPPKRGAPIPTDPSCADARSLYEAACLKSWVKYWDERTRLAKPLKVGVS
jgi:hypothetical protein